MELLFDRGTVTPQKLDGEITRIAFRGEGKARFRLQHTGDVDGVPSEFWVEVSGMSDGHVDPLSELDGYRPGMTTLPRRYIGGVRRPALVDQVNGNEDVLYRRTLAHWIRVIPLEGEDRECCHPCAGYRVTMEAERVGP